MKGEFILKEPKSKTSRRTLKLPASVLDALQEHRKAMLKEGQDVKTVTVFVSRTGTYIGKSNLIRYVFQPVLNGANELAAEKAKKAGAEAAPLPPIRFHDLCHNHASILLAGGASIKAVFQRLGHSFIGVTLKHCVHLLPGIDDALADQFDQALKLRGQQAVKAAAFLQESEGQEAIA